MNWFERLKSGIQTVVRRGMPERLYVKCERCHQMALRRHLESSAGICPNCGHHFRIRQMSGSFFFLSLTVWTEPVR